MATQVNVHHAKTHLSKLLARVEAGEEIVVARAGRPVARLVPHGPARGRRQPGSAESLIEILPGFDEYDQQIERDFGLLDDEE